MASRKSPIGRLAFPEFNANSASQNNIGKVSQFGPNGLRGYAIFWHEGMTIYDTSSALLGLHLTKPQMDTAPKIPVTR